MTTKRKLAKSAEQVAMEDALEVVLERAEWVNDKIKATLSEDYDVEGRIDDWCEESIENSVYAWLDDKYADEGPDETTLEKIVKDACREAVKKYVNEQIMLVLLDEVRANMGKLLGRAMKDYMNSINNVKE